MAGKCHNHQDEVGHKSQGLKRKIQKRIVVGVARKYRKDGVCISVSVKPKNTEAGMDAHNNKHTYSQVSAVIQ